SSVLTIAANTTLHGGSFGIVGRLINHGTLVADTAGGGFTITSANFLNEGTLRAESGGSLTLRGTWVTSRPFEFSGSGRLTLDGTWNYAFPLTVTSGTLTLAGNWQMSQPLTVRGATPNLSATTGA